MNIKCLILGHEYSVVHPDNVFFMEMIYVYAGTYAICERCGKRLKAEESDAPFMPAREDNQ